MELAKVEMVGKLQQLADEEIITRTTVESVEIFFPFASPTRMVAMMM